MAYPLMEGKGRKRMKGERKVKEDVHGGGDGGEREEKDEGGKERGGEWTWGIGMRG